MNDIITTMSPFYAPLCVCLRRKCQIISSERSSLHYYMLVYIFTISYHLHNISDLPWNPNLLTQSKWLVCFGLPAPENRKHFVQHWRLSGQNNFGCFEQGAYQLKLSQRPSTALLLPGCKACTIAGGNGIVKSIRHPPSSSSVRWTSHGWRAIGW